MRKTIGLVGHAPDHYEWNSILIGNETHSRAFHLACEGIEAVLENLHVALACNELFTCIDIADESSILADNIHSCLVCKT